MKTRAITSAVIVILAIPLFWFSETVVFPLVLAMLASLAVFEFLRVMKRQSDLALSIPAILIAFALPPLAFFLKESATAKETFLYCILCLFVYLLYLFFVAVFRQGDLPFSDVATVFTGVLYISLGFASLEMLRLMAHGLYLVILVFIAAWICDVFAYLVGRLLGRHKLIPRVSPNKTVEGSVGGIVFATAGFLLFGFLLARFADDVTPNYLLLAGSAIVLSVISQIGDLLASLIKREHGAKDYGNLFPGHGGVMDRFDSVLAVTTVLTILCLFVNPFV